MVEAGSLMNPSVDCKSTQHTCRRCLHPIVAWIRKYSEISFECLRLKLIEAQFGEDREPCAIRKLRETLNMSSGLRLLANELYKIKDYVFLMWAPHQQP